MMTRPDADRPQAPSPPAGTSLAAGERPRCSAPPGPAVSRTIPIEGCATVPVRPNSDDRGCLFEIFREEWPGAFKTV